VALEPFVECVVDRTLEVKSGVHSMIDQNSRINATDIHGSSSDGKAMSDDYDTLRADLSKLSQSVKAYAGENLGNAASDAQHAVQDQLGGLEAIVRKNPVQSALIAAGVGLVVGLIMTRWPLSFESSSPMQGNWLMASTSSKLHDISSTATSAAHDVIETASRNIEGAAHSLEATATAAQKSAGVQMERVEGMIRANPLAATGIAAGIGFLLALLARRS
jgi:ElaB/YqjD/DUF883 family membrane-anchored ribosome-binding protein